MVIDPEGPSAIPLRERLSDQPFVQPIGIPWMHRIGGEWNNMLEEITEFTFFRRSLEQLQRSLGNAVPCAPRQALKKLLKGLPIGLAGTRYKVSKFAVTFLGEPYG